MKTMADMLSQEEIDALLGGGGDASSGSSETFSDSDKDVLGEIGNISMGTAATTLSSLLNNKVVITTPKVNNLKWEALAEKHKDGKYVYVDIKYKSGLEGDNILFLKESDVKVIASLMMGGDGNLEEELSDLHLSAISEAMNQMIGSACTSMSSMFDAKIDIEPPKATQITFDETITKDSLGLSTDEFVEIAFKMEVGDLIDSEIMQLIPVAFARKMVEKMSGGNASEPEPEIMQQVETAAQKSDIMNNEKIERPKNIANVNAKPVAFESFTENAVPTKRSSIDIIKDVDLEVTVELGKAMKKVKEILGFNVGTIIELNRISGEPIDILVNGKAIAKGEVVVVDENFAIRITEIESVENRF